MPFMETCRIRKVENREFILRLRSSRYPATTNATAILYSTHFHPFSLKRDKYGGAMSSISQLIDFDGNCRSFGRDSLPTPGIDFKDVFTSKIMHIN